MHKKALEITLDTDNNSSIPVIGHQHKGCKALIILVGALLGGSEEQYAATKMAALHKTSAPKPGKENWIRGDSYTNIGASPGKNNPLTAMLSAFSTPNGYAGDPTGRGQYALTEEDIKRFGEAYRLYKALPMYKQVQQRRNNPPRGFVNPYRATPARFPQHEKPKTAQ